MKIYSLLLVALIACSSAESKAPPPPPPSTTAAATAPAAAAPAPAPAPALSPAPAPPADQNLPKMIEELSEKAGLSQVLIDDENSVAYVDLATSVEKSICVLKIGHKEYAPIRETILRHIETFKGALKDGRATCEQRSASVLRCDVAPSAAGGKTVTFDVDVSRYIHRVTAFALRGKDDARARITAAFDRLSGEDCDPDPNVVNAPGDPITYCCCDLGFDHQEARSVAACKAEPGAHCIRGRGPDACEAELEAVRAIGAVDGH